MIQYLFQPHVVSSVLIGPIIACTVGILVLRLAGFYRRSPANRLKPYLALADASAQIAYITDPDGACIAVSRYWTQATGQSEEEALQNGFHRLIWCEDRASEAQRRQEARRTGESFELQLRFRLRDGSYQWHVLRTFAVRDTHGKVIAWMSTASNVDAQVRGADSMRFLADASAAIVSSLDAGDNLATLARVATASFADFAAVWMRVQDEPARLVSFAHVDPALERQFGRTVRAHGAPLASMIVKRVMNGYEPHLSSDTEPLDALARERCEELNVTSLMIVPLDSGDEILGALVLARGPHRNRFDAQDLQLALSLAMRAGSAVANARLFESSRAVVKTLQSAFFPPFLPVMDGFAFEAVYRPAARDAQVGGDWYDVFPLRDGRLALSIGDIMGHGIAAATAMVRMRETIRAAAASLEADPSAVLAFANRAMCSSEGQSLATAVFAVYDPRSSCLDYAVAGHPRPLLVRDQYCIELDGSSGLVLGIDSDAVCTVGNATLEVGDRIVLYTDGLVECRQNVFEGEQRLRRAMCAHESAEAAVDMLLEEKQNDDVALLMMSIASAVVGEDGNSGWRFHSDDAASATSARTSFASYLARRGVAVNVIEIAELVFGELVSNVVRHAPGPIDIDVRFDAALPVLTVGDRGEGLSYQPGCASLPEDVLSESGRGLFLIEQLAATPHIQARRGGGSEITVPLRCDAARELQLA